MVFFFEVIVVLDLVDELVFEFVDLLGEGLDSVLEEDFFGLGFAIGVNE